MTHTTAEETKEEAAAVATVIFSKLQRGKPVAFAKRISKSRLIAKGKWRRNEVIRCCAQCTAKEADDTKDCQELA